MRLPLVKNFDELASRPKGRGFQLSVIPEAVRYHMRLFEFNNEVVGNVHFNRLEPDLEKMDLHKSDHERGLELLMRQLEGRHRVGVVTGRECKILIVDKCF
jgi:hypothetical protein